MFLIHFMCLIQLVLPSQYNYGSNLKILTWPPHELHIPVLTDTLEFVFYRHLNEWRKINYQSLDELTASLFLGSTALLSFHILSFMNRHQFVHLTLYNVFQLRTWSNPLQMCCSH